MGLGVGSGVGGIQSTSYTTRIKGIAPSLESSGTTRWNGVAGAPAGAPRGCLE